MTRQYQLRGNRVQPLPLNHIQVVAQNLAEAFKFNKRNKRNLDKKFESLSSLGITLNVVPDNDWLYITKGHCDPNKAVISVPQNIYLNACDGERDALAVMLHEMGHLFLGHRAVLHSSRVEAMQEEDAEWQADTFAEVILKIMGYQTAQLSFDFYV